ncbi:hypothetical protein CR51_00080 [Caballeronia megalochromosomata]|nr:hypothetical protein CR51_00080 [Caballeronia megalochromosomata]
MDELISRARESRRSEAYAEAPLSDYVPVLKGGWKTIMITTLSALAIGSVYLMLARPVYRASAMIQVEDRDPSARASIQSIETMFDSRGKAATDAEIELLRSREVVNDAVRTLHLDIQARPRHFPGFEAWRLLQIDGARLAPAFLGLDKFAWGSESIQVTTLDVPAKLLGKDLVLQAQGGDNFSLATHDGKVLGSGRVGEQSTFASPFGEVKLLVSALVGRPGTQFVLTRSSTVETTNELQDALMIAEKTKQSGIVSIALDGTDPARITDTINSIARVYVQENVSRRSEEAQRSLAFLNEQLPKVRHDVDLAEQGYNNFRSTHGTFNLSEEGRLLLQQEMDNRTRALALEQRKAELLQRFRASDPNVNAVSEQIDILRREADLLEHRAAALPDIEQTGLRLSRDVRINTDLYSDLLRSSQQLRIVAAAQVGSVRVVDYAFIPQKPVRPQRALVVVISAIAGLGLGILLVVMRTAIKGGIETPEAIEDAVGLRVLAVVPHSEAQHNLELGVRKGRRGERILAQLAPYDIAVEGVRSIRTALQLSPEKADNNIVMITGSRPSVGKSFLSMNLAAVSAVGGKRVLIVDTDLRNGALHASFHVRHAPGFSDAVSGCNVEEAIVPDVMPGVDLMPIGTQGLHPDEMLLSDGVRSTLAKLSRLYDLVIVDTPPVLVVTDAVLIGRHAGMTLLVVRHGCQPISETVDSIKRLRGGGIMPSGIILTDVPSYQLSYAASSAKYYGAPRKLLNQRA